MIIPINPDSIGDPNQTPVVYIGDAGEVLGIPERSAQDHAIGRANEAIRWLRADQREQTGSDWLPLSVREHFDHDWPALLADLEATREALRRAQAVVEKAQAVKAARGNTMALADAYWALAAAVDTYETQEGTDEADL